MTAISWNDQRASAFEAGRAAAAEARRQTDRAFAVALGAQIVVLGSADDWGDGGLRNEYMRGVNEERREAVSRKDRFRESIFVAVVFAGFIFAVIGVVVTANWVLTETGLGAAINDWVKSWMSRGG